MSQFDQISRLLLRCLAEDVQSSDLPDVTEREVWDRLVSRARRLGVAPLLYRQFQNQGIPVPAGVDSTLAQSYWATTAVNIWRATELHRILAALSPAQVPVILLKGAILAETVYPDIGTRSMADLDLLVPPARVDEADAIMGQLGYRTAAVDYLGHTKRFLRIYGGELTYYNRNGHRSYLDLHWRLIHQEGVRDVLDIDHDGLWQRSRRVVAPLSGARQLSVEDTTLYLALHLALHHQLGDFRSLLDVDRVIRMAGTVDWPGLALRARTWHVRYITYMVLVLSKELFSTPVPDAFLQSLRPSRFRLALLKQIVDGPRIADGTLRLGSKGERLFHLLLTDRTRDAFRFVFHTLWPESDWIVLRYRLDRKKQVGWYRVRHLARMVFYGLLSVGQLIGGILRQ